MKYFLGVDGGGSKTEAAILDENCNVLGAGRAGPGNYEVASMAAVKENWLAAIEKAKSSLGKVKFEKACFGLGGADFPEDFEILHKELDSLRIAPEVILENDTTIALRAGVKEDWGILIIMGSGSNGLGKKKDGTAYRFYGEGFEYGDWGGSFLATQDMLFHAFRSHDGRGEKTILEDMALGFFRVNNFDEMAKKLYYHPEERAKVLNFAPLLFKAIEKQDAVAVKLGEKIVNETVKSIYALMKKLDLLEEATPIVLCGSLYKGAPWLPEYISAKTHMFAPLAKVDLLKSLPVMGAALIAWETNGNSLSEDKWQELSKYKINHR